MDVPDDVTAETLTLFLELDTGPLAGVVREKEAMPVER
jgi:hypothetical protein